MKDIETMSKYNRTPKHEFTKYLVFSNTEVFKMIFMIATEVKVLTPIHNYLNTINNFLYKTSKQGVRQNKLNGTLK